MRGSGMTWRLQMAWLAGALALGLASQWCTAFGPCAAPLP